MHDKLRRPVRIGRRLYEHTHVDGSKSFYADFDFDGRQRRVKLVARTRLEARRAQSDLIAKGGRGEAVAPTAKTFEQVGDEWLAQLDVKPRTREAYDYHLRVNLGPTLGRRRIQSITPQDVGALIAHLRDERKLSGWTQASAVVALNGVMAYAVWTGLISQNPVAQVPRTKRPKRRLDHEHRFLSAAEIDALLGLSPPSYQAAIYIAVWTGMRENEVLGLTYGDLDLKAGRINLRAQLSRPKKDRPPERVPLKTDKARRIDIDPGLVMFLRGHRERQLPPASPRRLTTCLPLSRAGRSITAT
jgi:integrase